METGQKEEEMRGSGGRRGEACTCRRTLKWKQSERSERVLDPSSTSLAHPFRPLLSPYTEEGKLYSWIKFVFDRMAVEGIILREEGVRDEAIEFVTVACLSVELWAGLSCSGDSGKI